MVKTKYKHLVAWCKMMGSYNYYIEDQIAKAKATNAPEDAIYEKMAEDGSGPTDEWARFSEVTNQDTKMKIERLLESL